MGRINTFIVLVRNSALFKRAQIHTAFGFRDYEGLKIWIFMSRDEQNEGLRKCCMLPGFGMRLQPI